MNKFETTTDLLSLGVVEGDYKKELRPSDCPSIRPSDLFIGFYESFRMLSHDIHHHVGVMFGPFLSALLTFIC